MGLGATAIPLGRLFMWNLRATTMARALPALGIFGILVAIALQGLSGTKGSSARAESCKITSRVLLGSLDRIGANPQAKLRPLSCKQVADIEAANPESLEITTGRLSGKPVICISSSRAEPCRFVLAELQQDADPTSVLVEIFNHQQTSTVLNETVERLFIRPSKYIK